MLLLFLDDDDDDDDDDNVDYVDHCIILLVVAPIMHKDDPSRLGLGEVSFLFFGVGHYRCVSNSGGPQDHLI